MTSELGTADRPLRVAVIGSGPAGFYTTAHLLKQSDVHVQVDMFDRLPTPFGLVRFGVAPDHQKIKNVTRVFDRIAQQETFRFFGDVQVGKDISLTDLSQHFHQICYATGAETDRRMGIPGEDLPKVSHYYHAAHPYFDRDVAVIGGRNSAAEAALDLYRNGARVTLIHHSARMSDKIKYWVRPDIDNRITSGEIKALFDTRVTAIRPDSILVAPTHSTDGEGEVREIKNDFVFALIGYKPDADFLRMAGVHLEPRRMRPVCNLETLESNVPGIYLAGVIIAGLDTNEIFIENGRHHGKQILADLTTKLRA